MTYQETLDKIHSFQKYGSRLGLERMTRLMELLGNPQERMNVIHVAGTNGKGSVCRYLYSVLQENGYKTGLYISPFLERFTERIEFNGLEISEEDLARCTELVLEKVDQLISEGMDSPTEFELITAIAFHYFSEQEMDFLVLEVGLGGVGDSTNVMSKPAVSVITSISFDHMEYLGDTLEKIAVQKAGIIKPGVPVICHVEDETAASAIVRIAEEKGAPVYGITDIAYQIREMKDSGYIFDTVIQGTPYERLAISMMGLHQIENAVCALTVLEILKKEGKVKLDKRKTYLGFQNAKHNGRFEIMGTHPYIIIDGAHNEAGAEALAAAIKNHFPEKKILMVMGILADKKIDKLVEIFGSIADEFVATEPDSPRKLVASVLCEKLQNAGKQCIAVPDPEEACGYVAGLHQYDVILFAGSLYLIGKVRGILGYEKEQSASIL